MSQFTPVRTINGLSPFRIDFTLKADGSGRLGIPLVLDDGIMALWVTVTDERVSIELKANGE